MLANTILPYFLKKKSYQNNRQGNDIIISLTSFPARINNVWQVVRTLQNQSLQPEKIILWLSKDQFPTKDTIPNTLWECVNDIFEIQFVDGDIRSHKKYYYSLLKYPDKTIVTCDDDIYYHPDMLLNLAKVSKLYPNCVIANRTTQMTWDEEGELLPYVKWNSEFKPYSSLNNVQIGIMGVLYPPHSLHRFVTRDDLFLKLSPLADDLWLSLMARLNGTPVIQTPIQIEPLPIKNDSQSLTSVNNGSENMNDKQILRMREWLKIQGLSDVYSQNYKIEALKSI